MDEIMPIRFTNSGKWADKWFRNLSPNAKTLYWYMWDMCDIAGFWEIDFDHAAYHTKIPEDEIEGAFKGLCRGYIEVDGHIWIRRFLYHQRNLPLNENNAAHKGILRKIDEHKSLFPNVLTLIEQQGASKGLDSPTGISKGKGTSKSKSKSKSKVKQTKIPDNLNDPKFLKAWEDWQKHRTEIKHKLTPITIERQLKMLSGVPIDNAVAIIETSIQNGWQGLFPDRLETHSATKKTKLYPLRGGQNCSKRGCGRPAVHKDSSGSYDSFSCSKHLPAKMKEDFE